jgi:hypothetical protein
VEISYSPSGPVCAEYLRDRSFVSLIEGPVGSGKTVSTFMKQMAVALSQRPWERVRYTRHMIVRNTYPELRSTVIKSFQEWFPEGVAPINWASPITAKLDFWLPDKTRVKTEFLFLALDRPEDVGKLRSLEVTTAAGSEMSELNKATFDMMTQRVGRYPPQRWGGADFYGVMGDTNFPDDDHWIYRIFEEEKPEGFKLFKQPGGLVDKGGGVYEKNPLAENIANLPGGHEYYLRQLGGKNKEWIKVYLCAQYGTINTGRAVYPNYNDELHCRDIKPYAGMPLLIGMDYGLTPAAAICQVSPKGQFRVYGEVCTPEDVTMGVRQFSRDLLKPYLAMHFPGYKVQIVGDPAGNQRADSDEKTCFLILAEEGFPAMPACPNNDPGMRKDAVNVYLTGLSDGQPNYLISPNARMIRKGMNGGYNYKRVQVTGDERYRDVPDKNEYSHPVEAMEYAAVFSRTMNLSQDFGKKIVYPQLGVV